MIQRRMTAAMPPMVLAMAGFLMAADSDSDVLKKPARWTAWRSSPACTTRRVEPSWPQPLPNNWILGQIGGLYVLSMRMERQYRCPTPTQRQRQSRVRGD